MINIDRYIQQLDDMQWYMFYYIINISLDIQFRKTLPKLPCADFDMFCDRNIREKLATKNYPYKSMIEYYKDRFPDMKFI